MSFYGERKLKYFLLLNSHRLTIPFEKQKWLYFKIISNYKPTGKITFPGEVNFLWQQINSPVSITSKIKATLNH